MKKGDRVKTVYGRTGTVMSKPYGCCVRIRWDDGIASGEYVLKEKVYVIEEL